MKLILLRGQVPQDRNPKEILFDRIEDCDDIYTQLAYRLGDQIGSVWYWGGKGQFNYGDRFAVTYHPDFRKVVWHPEDGYVIWARGGFKEYKPILDNAKNAFKIYYGAGKNFMPDRPDYNLVLCDSKYQLGKVREKFPNTRAELWIKPAADNIIKPEDCRKQYDVCFVANEQQAERKRIPWVYKTKPKDISMLHLGSGYKRVLRKDIGHYMSKCRVGIIPYNEIDSCPRAMVEMLACGLPVVAMDTVRFWNEKYVSVNVSRKENFWETVQWYLSGALRPGHVLDYYQNHLSLDKAAEYLKNLIKEGMNG